MYIPREDSYFLSEQVDNFLNKIKNKNIKILDVGAGTGIQAETCLSLGFKNILCVDIDKESIDFLKKKKFKAIKSNLFSNPKLNSKKFNLIVFNPPYLPEDKTGFDKEKDTTGGKYGYEAIIRFLKQAKNHLKKDGKILLLFSSLSNSKIIKKKAEELGYSMKLLAKKRIFFEELFVYEVT